MRSVSLVASFLLGLVGLNVAHPTGLYGRNASAASVSSGTQPPTRPRLSVRDHLANREADRRALGSLVEATFPEGTVVGSSLDGIDSFRGIPFAQPPVGNLRLRPPQRLNTSLSSFDATGLPPSCPQMVFSDNSGDLLSDLLGEIMNSPLFQTVGNIKEDCLALNVQRPSNTAADAKLPVLLWIFGGGFELGSTAMYDGTDLLQQGIKLNEPFVFVAINYRVAGFGFLGGKEIKADGAANLGLLDQRMALEWVADNIASFGGDPDRVTIWGESAGAISVFDQMALYDGNIVYKGKPLFRAGIMNSGSIIPSDPVDCPKAQAIYDQVVAAANCDSAASSLACLRAAPYDTFLNAVNSVPGILSYNSVALSYLPRPDGTVLTDSPDALLINKRYATMPIIIGDQEDEGTLFSLFPKNITSKDRIVEYLSSLFFHDATTTQLATLVDTYPETSSAGSPFRTGIFNEFFPGFKRLAAILGDLVFTLSRRALLTAVALEHGRSMPSWSYLASYDHGTPYLGTFHGSDLLQVFYGLLPNYASNAIQTYYINFLYNLDPNVGAAVSDTWPQWGDGNKLMQFFSDKGELLDDNFRSDSFQFIIGNVASLRI